MKRLKKLTRSQRNILEKLGIEGTENIQYLEERGDVVIFVRDNGEEVPVNKATYYKMK